MTQDNFDSIDEILNEVDKLTKTNIVTTDADISPKFQESNKSTGSEKLGNEKGAKDMSASTLIRVMGVATSVELKLVEAKIDLITAKLSSTIVKLERVLSNSSSMPSGGDFERLELQISNLKNLIVTNKPKEISATTESKVQTPNKLETSPVEQSEKTTTTPSNTDSKTQTEIKKK